MLQEPAARARVTAVIYLPPDMERVEVGRIPSLIANALHPEDFDAPTVLSRLLKKARSLELMSQWHDKGDIPPTPDEIEALNASAWTALPPLVVDGDGKPGQTITESQWQPYAAALAANPPRGWRLIPYWRNTRREMSIANHTAKEEHWRLVVSHAAQGVIRPKSPQTRIEEPTAAGERLKECYITRAEFEEYAQRFAIRVEPRREYVRRGIVQPLVNELRKLPRDEVVVIHYESVRQGESTATSVREHLALLDDIAKRQADGFLTLKEAALVYCETNQQHSPEKLLEEWGGILIVDESWSRKRRILREQDRIHLTEDDPVSPWRDYLVKVEDIDKLWSVKRGFPLLSAAVGELGQVMPDAGGRKVLGAAQERANDRVTTSLFPADPEPKGPQGPLPPVPSGERKGHDAGREEDELDGCSSMRRVRDAMVSLIASAQAHAADPDDAQAVYAVIKRWSEVRKPPLVRFVEGAGVEWDDQGKTKYLTVKKLGQRLRRRTAKPR